MRFPRHQRGSASPLLEPVPPGILAQVTIESSDVTAGDLRAIGACRPQALSLGRSGHDRHGPRDARPIHLPPDPDANRPLLGLRGFAVHVGFGDRQLRAVTESSRLGALVLAGTRVTTDALAEAGTNVLEHLFVSDSSAIADDLGFLSVLTSLRIMGLRKAGLRDRHLDALASLEQLWSLDLTGTVLSDGTAPQLATLANLVRLTLADTTVGDATVQHLGRLPSVGDDLSERSRCGSAHRLGLLHAGSASPGHLRFLGPERRDDDEVGSDRFSGEEESMASGDSLTIRSARLRRNPDLVDIRILDGHIAAVAPAGESGPATDEIDAAGNLVTESFVNAHLHLDKVFTLSDIGDAALADYQTGAMGKAMSAIETAAAVKERQQADAMVEAGRRALSMAAYYGTTHIRALADVDAKSGTRGFEVLVDLRAEFDGLVDVQVVAFAQDGIVREPGTEALLRESMALGADVVGGIPWIEYTEPDMAEHIRIVFDIAGENDAPVSMLLDDAGDPGLRTLELMATEALRRGWEGRALAHHARAMALYPDPYFERLVALLRASQVAVVSDPHTGPLHARVRELTGSGVSVCLGQDDISDAYYAFGRNNMLEVAFLAAHLLWMMSGADLDLLYDLITVNPASAIGLEDHRLTVGNVANLVVLEGETVSEALRFHAAPRAVLSHGRVVDREALKAAAAVPD